MKAIHALFFDQHSTIFDIASFYFTMAFMYTVGFFTVLVVSPRLACYLFVCVMLVIFIIWLIAKKGEMK